MSDKLQWTDRDLAETEQTGYEHGYAQAFAQLEHELRIWQRPSALNFTREVRRLMQICWTGKEQPRTELNGYDQGVLAERMRIKRILHRHLLDDGNLIWHANKNMTKSDLEQLIDDGQG
jgi:hypothetical protein